MPLSIDLRDPALVGDVPVPGQPKDAPGSQWPRQLRLSVDCKKRLVDFLDSEIQACISEREPMVADWIVWQKDYWAKPETAEKNFPFKRAANIVIPLTAIAVEAIYARIMNTLFAIEPFYAIRPRISDFVEAAPAIEEWYQTEVEGPLNVFGFCRESLLELIKLGTGVGKSGYEHVVKKSLKTYPDGHEDAVYVDVFNGATLDYVPLANFLMRVAEKDPQEAMWCGEEHQSSWSQMKRMALSGRWYSSACEEIKAHRTTKGSGDTASGKYESEVDTLAKTEPMWSDVYYWQEIWLSFDVDGDGVDEEIVVDFHRETKTILSARYNWYDDLHRPYRIGVYIPVEGRWPGIGVGKQNEQFQKLITTMHRQRLDNATLANMAQLALKKTSGYGPNEPMWPGKIWFLENPQTDMKEFKLSEAYVGEIQHEEYARQYSDKRVGTNELVLGLPHEGTPATATSDVTRLAESNKKFDLVLKNIRIWLGTLGMDCLANYQQFGLQEFHWLTEGPIGGQFVDRFLRLPPTLVRRGAIVEVKVVDSTHNSMENRQQWTTVFAMLTQYYDKALERAMVLNDKQTFLALGGSALQAGDYLIRRLLETFREARLDIDELLLYEKFMKRMDDAQSSGVPPGPTSGPLQPVEAGGMAAPSGLLGTGG